MFESIFVVMLILHIIAVMIAVGTVTVTDYLHILGLRDPALERKTLFVYPHLSNLIRIALALVYSTGIIMTIARPSFLQNPLFWLKMALVLVVTVNGFILHHLVFPKIEHGIRKKQYPKKLMRQAALGGSLSIVSWYGIVILALTKNVGYRPIAFIIFYIIAFMVAYLTAVHMETKTRKKHHHLFENLRKK